MRGKKAKQLRRESGRPAHEKQEPQHVTVGPSRKSRRAFLKKVKRQK